MIYSDNKKKPINKVEKIDVVSDNDAEMADKIVYKNVHSTTS